MTKIRFIKKKIYGKAIVSFFVTFALCASLISVSVINKVSLERLAMEQLIIEKSTKANEVISRLLYKTQTLAALLIRNNGEVNDFNQIAATIVDDPAILNVLVAPGGVVSDVYPTAGNEAVLGLDYFSEGAGNKEAMQAKETGQLVFGGPFTSVQGEEVLVGRLPVYIHGADGTKEFWGLVSVTLKYPQALDGCGFNELQIQGFAYEIWRMNPDNGQKQIITNSGYKYNKAVRYIEKQVLIQNAEWYFRILPVKAWYEYLDTWMLVLLGLCISVLVAYVMQNNSELKKLKTNFENLSNTDSLTELHNRRFMDERLSHIIRSLSRSNGTLSVMMIDVDFFKNYNDTYGHDAGDHCLKIIAKTIANSIEREEDIAVRYGGEEFVVILPNTDEKGARIVADRLLENIRRCNLPHKSSDVSSCVTVSIGVATASVKYSQNAEEYIRRSDEALYMSKSNGRNRFTLCKL